MAPFAEILLIASVSYFVVIGTNLLALTVGAWLFKKQVNPSGAPLRIAVIIPAYNEASHISRALEALNNSAYPHELFKVMVIADNCTDNTSSVARKSGATVFERSDEKLRGKGFALDWFFKTHREAYSNYDAVSIIDADTMVDKQFLKEISSSLSHSEVSAVQGHLGVLNYNENMRTALSAAASNVFNHLRAAGHNSLGGTAGLRGNGMAFLRKVPESYGWPSHSVIEDAEFSFELLLKGQIVHYNPDAVVYAEMPAGRKQAETQRIRWESSRLYMLRKFLPPVTKALVRTRRPCYLDAIISILTPPLSVYVMGIVALYISAIFKYERLFPALYYCLAALAAYVISGQIMRKAPLVVWASLVSSPFYVLWKLPVYVKIAVGKNKGSWVRTLRRSEISK